ncbi:MAG TPA: DUF4197 domain-containing protein [Alphaproteobacteria bacterium]|nr:DUF4197 domain-containing protein [Alphaproteobacteria bacterium]
MHATRHAMIFGLVLLCATAVVPAPSQAASDWTKDLLKSLGIGSSSKSDVSGLTTGEISGGLREALRIGSERVVSTLGRPDGFNKSPDVHIPLPGSLKTAQKMLAKVGKSKLGDDLELRLNRAAEAAVPKAKGLFADAISQMTIDDAKTILNGPKDSATQYFRRKMSPRLTEEMTPIVTEQLTDVGAIKSYDKMMGKYEALPFVPDVKANLTSYVVGKAIDGVFLYLGREEAAIRENPAKRTTDLLKKVFGR